MNPSPTFSLVGLNEDRTQAAASSNSCPIFFNSLQDQGGNYDGEQLKHHQQLHDYMSQGRSSNNHCSLESSLHEGDDIQNGNGSLKWVSSKMRLMRKMMNSDRTVADDNPIRTTKRFQDQQQLLPIDTDIRSNNSFSSNSNNNNNNNNTIRVCVDCNTTKTPLWRGGPRGPKSLCNACGIRQRKARRAMAEAASSSTDASSTGIKVRYKEKKLDQRHEVAYKEQCKLGIPPDREKKLCFEDFTLSLSKNLDFHQVFPQDEKEAAILLMALSCGLING